MALEAGYTIGVTFAVIATTTTTFTNDRVTVKLLNNKIYLKLW